jgi:hypothetical protein
MVHASRTFRVFVSSTFDDLTAKRNALRDQVLPRTFKVPAEEGSVRALKPASEPPAAAHDSLLKRPAGSR